MGRSSHQLVSDMKRGGLPKLPAPHHQIPVTSFRAALRPVRLDVPQSVPLRWLCFQTSLGQLLECPRVVHGFVAKFLEGFSTQRGPAAGSTV